jgi:soluble lytic murein transglycosylase-like protein
MAYAQYSTGQAAKLWLRHWAGATFRRTKKYLRGHWKPLLMRGLLTAPVALGGWLFMSVEVRLNDAQTIARRAQTLGGLGLTPYFVYSNTPPLYTMADKAALRHGIDPLLFRALIYQESRWDPQAVSPVGAAGLTQLMPQTALSECGLLPEARFDPYKNLDCGAYYLAKQLRRFKSVDLALAAYNAGPERVAKLGRIPRIRETQTYVSNIMASWSGGV